MSVLISKIARIIDLTEEEKKVLLQACTTTLEYPAHHDIVQMGDRPWKSNLLMEGMVCRYRTIGSGRRQILAFQYPGDVFDAYSFVLEIMDHSIATLAPSKIAQIPHEAMVEITEKHPRLTRALWKDTLIDASVFAEWMTNLRAKTPEAQVAHLLCEMVTRFGVVGLANDDEIDWPLTATEISDALGVSVDFVGTVMRQFHARGWITIHNARLTAHRLDQLKKLAEFDPTYLHLNSPHAAGRV